MSKEQEPQIGECCLCHLEKLLTHEIELTLRVGETEISVEGDACDDCVPKAIEEFAELQQTGASR